MESNGVYYTSAKCAAKWKSLKDRYSQIRENINKNPNCRRTPWPFFEKMHYLCGDDDRNTLEHVQDVGACGISSRKNKRNAETSEPRFARKKKTRIPNAESLDRLIELEEKKEQFDQELLETLRDQKESRQRKDDAMIAAAKSFQEVSAAIIASLNQQR